MGIQRYALGSVLAMNTRRGNNGTGLRNRGLLFLGGVAITFLIILSTYSFAEETCCLRAVYVLPFTFEKGYSFGNYEGRHAATSFAHSLHDAFLLDRCPLRIDITGMILPEKQNYQFRGTLTADEIKGTDGKGKLWGRFSARVQLIDPHHGNAVLREESISWSGTSDWGGLKEWYEPSQDRMNASWFGYLEELGKRFMPFNETIRDYERMPESCKAEMEKEKVDSGEKIQIRLKPQDSQGRQPQPWQRIVVKAKKGKILNGTKRDMSADQSPEFVFTVESGTIEVEYQAPEDCEKTTETLTILNSCDIQSEAIHPLWVTSHRRTIATKEFQVVSSLPESVKIEPDRDPVNAGQTISIHLKDILDGEGKTPLPDKELYIQVEKGFLVSDRGKSKGLFVQVGDGHVKLRYQAPTECRKTTERITIQNKCIKRTNTGEEVIYRQIGEKRFDVECHDVIANITGTANWRRDDIRYTSQLAMQIRITGTMKLKWAGKDAEHYECDRMQLHYQHHEKVVDKKKGCIETEVSGAGSSTISGGSFILSFRKGQLTIKFDLEPLELNVKRECGKLSGDEKRKGYVTVNMIVNEKLDRSQKLFTGHRTWEIPDLKKDLNRPAPSQGFFQIPFMSNEFDASKIFEQFGVKAPATMQPFPSPGPDMKLEWKFEKTKSDNQKAGSDNDRREKKVKKEARRATRENWGRVQVLICKEGKS